MGSRVLLDEGSVAGSDGRLARDAGCPRDGVGVVLRHDGRGFFLEEMCALGNST